MLDFTFTTRHMHNCVSFLFWPSSLSGPVSLLFPSGILDTFWPRRLIFWCHIFLPFYTVHGVLKARILKWFAIPFSSEPCFVIASLSYTSPFATVVLWSMWSFWLAFWDCGFYHGGCGTVVLASSNCLLVGENSRLMQASRMGGTGCAKSWIFFWWAELCSVKF